MVISSWDSGRPVRSIAEEAAPHRSRSGSRAVYGPLGPALMDFRLLGPLEVVEGGRSLALGGVKQRSLLSVLALHANQAVPAERLVFELWGERPPASAGKSGQIPGSRPRQGLGAERGGAPRPGYPFRR